MDGWTDYPTGAGFSKYPLTGTPFTSLVMIFPGTRGGGAASPGGGAVAALHMASAILSGAPKVGIRPPRVSTTGTKEQALFVASTTCCPKSSVPAVEPEPGLHPASPMATTEIVANRAPMLFLLQAPQSIRSGRSVASWCYEISHPVCQ